MNRLIGDKWEWKTPFLVIFDPRLSIVKSLLDCRLSSVLVNSLHGEKLYPFFVVCWLFSKPSFIKTRKSVHGTRMPPPIVFISPAIKHWVYNKWTGYHLHTTNWIYSNIILIKRVIIWASSWENRLFAYAKTKTQISVAVTAKLISAFVFAIRIVQTLYYLNSKFQASSHLLWLYSPVCVGPGRINKVHSVYKLL